MGPKPLVVVIAFFFQFLWSEVCKLKHYRLKSFKKSVSLAILSNNSKENSKRLSVLKNLSNFPIKLKTKRTFWKIRLVCTADCRIYTTKNYLPLSFCFSCFASNWDEVNLDADEMDCFADQVLKAPNLASNSKVLMNWVWLFDPSNSHL